MAPSAPGNPIFDTLNEAQRKAVGSNADTVAILAGPGSGKTHTLTSRVAYLVDSIGYRPQDVIVATFTVKAAREMQARIGKALGDGREKKIVLGTFHSISRRYLAAYGQRIGLNQKFSIADDSDSRAIIARICKRLQLAVDPPAARAWISKKKAKGTEPEPATRKGQQAAKHPRSQDLETCYEEYQSHLERSNLLDYDDLLVRCVELLRKFPSCVSNVQAVLIDEYQDTNGVQYELMKLFAQSRRRITIVGDPDQSIYGWRSAEIRNLWRLLRDFPGTDEVALEENYRSSQSILDLSLMIIQQDAKRYQKALRPVHNKGSRPVLRKLKDSSTEADWIVSEIRRAIAMSGDMMTHNDVAILLRSASLSRHIEHALGRSGIAYKMIGGFKFYERAEIKTILDYLRVIHQPENNDALARIMNVPKRGIGDTTIKALLEEAEKASLSLFALLDKHCRGDRFAKTKIMKHAEQKISGDLLRIIKGTRKRIDEATSDTPFGLVEMIEQLLTQLKFQKFLEDTHSQDHEQRWANVQEFLVLGSDFVKELERTEDDDTLPEIEGLKQTNESDALAKFLANVALATEVQKDDKDQESTQVVTISTIHAAKGLEWPIVFVPAAYNGSIPHARSEDDDEERRLLYVAMTRAKSLLYLSYPLYSSHGKGEKNELSPFLSPQARSFARKGPCFDRPVMEAIAGILQRQLPSQDAIFKSIPPMFALEDNLQPEDPESASIDNEIRRGRTDDYDEFRASRSKRPRLSGPTASGGGGGSGSDEQPWRKEYATTMEQASSFTVSALPGFVSAGVHRAALATTTKVPERANVVPKGVRPSANRRPLDQKSIMGFVKTGPGGNAPSRPVPAVNHMAKIEAPLSRQPLSALPNASSTARPAIDPRLANYKLGAGRMATKPARPRRDEEDAAGKQYPSFSSSPTKAEGSKPALAGDNGDDDDDDSPLEPTRAATCLHATTCNMPKGLGGFRRPVGLGRAGIAPIDKLRKPFKPLTMNRP